MKDKQENKVIDLKVFKDKKEKDIRKKIIEKVLKKAKNLKW